MFGGSSTLRRMKSKVNYVAEQTCLKSGNMWWRPPNTRFGAFAGRGLEMLLDLCAKIHATAPPDLISSPHFSTASHDGNRRERLRGLTNLSRQRKELMVDGAGPGPLAPGKNGRHRGMAVVAGDHEEELRHGGAVGQWQSMWNFLPA
jgi:hypothetical protein